jgi:hypothetical protein
MILARMEQTTTFFNGENRLGSPATETQLPGEYELERISNPYHLPKAPWLVFKGTKIGMTEAGWLEMVEDPSYGLEVMEEGLPFQKMSEEERQRQGLEFLS